MAKFINDFTNYNVNQKELEKYLEGKQSAVATYSALKIGKTSFYKILKDRNIKK